MNAQICITFNQSSLEFVCAFSRFRESLRRVLANSTFSAQGELFKQLKSDGSLRQSPLNVDVRRRARPLDVASLFHLHLIHVQFAVTLDALGHAVLGARTSLCAQAKRCKPAVHSRTSSRPSKRSRQDDRKLEGGGKLQKLQQEAGDELQQEVGDVDLKVTLFVEHTQRVCLDPPWCLACAAWNLEKHRGGYHGKTFITHSQVLAGHGNSARILVENVSKRSDRAQVMEIHGNLLNEGMSPRQFCNEILTDLFAEVIDLAELPVRSASWLPEVRKAARRLKQRHLDKIAAK